MSQSGKHTERNRIRHKCVAEGCRAVQGFPSRANLHRHEKEIHGMHGASKKMNCPIATCERHIKEGFKRQDQLNAHLQRKHKQGGSDVKQSQKRKVRADQELSIEAIKHLRDDTRGLQHQFDKLKAQSANIMCMIQELEEKEYSEVVCHFVESQSRE